jgi:hypothetical protein
LTRRTADDAFDADSNVGCGIEFTNILAVDVELRSEEAARPFVLLEGLGVSRIYFHTSKDVESRRVKSDVEPARSAEQTEGFDFFLSHTFRPEGILLSSLKSDSC